MIYSHGAAYVGGYTQEPIPIVAPLQILDATDESLTVAQWPKKRPFKNRERQILFSIPLSEVEEVQVESIANARSEYGWKLSTGFLHGPARLPAVTGVVFILATGENVLFRMTGAPVEVRAQMAPVIERIADLKARRGSAG